MKRISITSSFIIAALLTQAQAVLESFDFVSGAQQYQLTDVNSVNSWCVENSLYSIDGYSLQICSNGAAGYSGANGSTAICFFNINATNYSTMTLEFDWRCNGEENLDFGTVYYSLENSNFNTPIWSELATNFQSGDNSINHAVVKLPLAANYKSNLKIGFSFKSDSFFNFQPGFVVDNIQLKGYECTSFPMAPAQQAPFEACQEANDYIDLTVQQVTGFNYNWYRDEYQIVFHQGGSYQANRYFNQSYLVTSVNNSGCENKPPHTVVSLEILPKPAINLVELVGTTVGNDGLIEINVADDDYEILWQNASGEIIDTGTTIVDSLNAGLYFVQVTDTNACDSVRVFAVEEGATILVPSAFSPNGDGLNDFWFLEGIDQWDDFELAVYTMSNRLVFSQLGNEANRRYIPWNGTNMHTNELVPDGDYIYVLSSEEKQRKYRGIVSIKTN